MNSLFFALQPDPAAATQAAELAARLRADHGLKALAATAERLHVTLHHLGSWPELPEDLVTKARQAAQSLQSPAFELRFDGVTSFRSRARRHPLVLVGREAMPALQAFRLELGAALRAYGVPVEQGVFAPHMTLLRDTQVVPDLPVAPMAWKAREFVLIQSLVGEGWHGVLGRWPLHG